MITGRPAILACACISMSLLLIASGCGYNHAGSGGGFDSRASSTQPSASRDGYQWKTIYRQDVRSVSVPIFKTVSFARGVEFDLSKAVVSQIEANTPYKVMPRERADTILEGEVVDVRIDTLSNTNQGNIPQEQLLDIRINFVWKDLRTGRVLVERTNMQRASTFYPTLGEGRFVGTQEAVEKLALAIVNEMQSDW